MKTSAITYSKVFPLGGYSNEKIGVEIEIEAGDDVNKVIQQARQYVEFNHRLNGVLGELEQCETVLSDPDNYTGTQVKRAQQRKDEINKMIQEGMKLLNS